MEKANIVFTCYHTEKLVFFFSILGRNKSCLNFKLLKIYIKGKEKRKEPLELLKLTL